MPPVRDPADLKGSPELDEVLKRLPSRLYKFCGLSGPRAAWMRRQLVNSELYFARPSEFNDPLDCRVPPRFEASRLEIEQYWRRVAKEHYVPRDKRAQRARVAEITRESKTEDGQARLSEGLFATLNQNGMVCLARNATNTLLWSYYADGHAGIALRFDMTAPGLADFGQPFLPVEIDYRDTFPPVNFFKSSTSQFINAILGTKSNAWKHEEEWRLVLPGRYGYQRVGSALIDGVILGMRIAPAVEREVRGWVAGRHPKVEFQRVVHKRNSFQLDLVPG